MRYFDAFSGYGGFSLGIQKAYVEVSTRSKVGGIKEDTEGNDETGERLESVQGEADSVSGRQYSSNLTNGENERPPHCVGFSEIDKYAVQIYQKHFPYEQCGFCSWKSWKSGQVEGIPNQPNASGNGQDEQYTSCHCKHKPYGDITKLDPTTLPDFDLLVGGFPCQAFSIAGKRGGFEDTRGTLIYDVLRIVKEKHPKLVLLENVKGLLSHDSGRTFKTIITALAELGYAVEWQVLNAKDFGVPQNRERVFIIGHLGGFGGRKVFPITRSNGENIRTSENDEHQSNRSSISSGRYLPNTQHITGREAYAIRRLTPTECERLMGLPDGWTEGVSDTQRYKLCGNGVVVNVVEEIIKRLL